MPEIIQKIVVRDVGVLRAFDTPNSPRLAPMTLIYGGNGRGKTTLTSILKASATGDAAALKGRTTLGLGNAEPQVIIKMNSSAAIFRNSAWNRTAPVEVFDVGFISENLFAGEAVDLQHDRRLFSIILGAKGVKLAKQQEFIVDIAKRRAAALKDAEKALQNDVPSDMSLEEFFALSKDADITAQIVSVERDLKALQDADRLARIKKVEPLRVPEILLDLTELLARTVSDIESTARHHMAAHFSKFKLGARGEAWVRFGLEHLEGDDCPFCGKSGVDDQGLVSAYSQIFGDAYQQHFEAIKAGASTIDNACGPEAIANLERTIAANAETIRSWADYIDVSSIEFPNIQQAIDALEKAHTVLKPLLDRKRQEPLVVVSEATDITIALSEFATAEQMIGHYNVSVHGLNTLIGGRSEGTRLTDQQLRTRLQNLIRRQRRHDPGVQSRIDNLLATRRKDARARSVRTTIQVRLKTANTASAAHYHDKVNEYLSKFGATFSISEISNSMAGNAGSVDYGLIVRGHPISRSRGRENVEEATFANTLSTGDKTTLAFAFFLAGLDRLADLDHRIIVFDDPLSSHDTHRKNKTVDLLADLCVRCAQVIVLSHDAHFLRQASKRCHHADQAVYEIAFEGVESWSNAKIADLDVLCQSDHAYQLRKLKVYYESRVGEPSDVAPAVRKVLETHYRRAFTAYFGPSDDLGTMVKSIKEQGSSHICWADVSDLESCNIATLPEHHGEDPRLASRGPIDADELHRIVTDCLTLIKAIRPSDGTVRQVA